MVEGYATLLRELDAHFEGRARVLMSGQVAIETELEHSDVVIGAVLIPGAAARRNQDDGLFNTRAAACCARTQAVNLGFAAKRRFNFGFGVQTRSARLR